MRPCQLLETIEYSTTLSIPFISFAVSLFSKSWCGFRLAWNRTSFVYLALLSEPLPWTLLACMLDLGAMISLLSDQGPDVTRCLNRLIIPWILRGDLIVSGLHLSTELELLFCSFLETDGHTERHYALRTFAFCILLWAASEAIYVFAGVKAKENRIVSFAGFPR